MGLMDGRVDCRSLLDREIQDVAERLATAGYVEIASELYSAGGSRLPVLDSRSVTGGTTR